MKIRPEHYAYMRDAIAALHPNIDALRAAIIAEGKSKDPDKRLRWDLSYAARLTPWICDNLYSYVDDTHIDTALKRIVAEMSTAPCAQPVEVSTIHEYGLSQKLSNSIRCF